MAISFSKASATISTSEYSLVNNSTSLAASTTQCMLQAWIDFAAMVAGDQYEIKIKEKTDAGTQRVIYDSVITGAQVSPFVSPALVVGEGWDVTVTRLLGADRSILWSLRQVA